MRETTEDAGEPLAIERRDGALIITIQREQRMNALDRRTIEAFGKVQREQLRDTDRAIVVTGRGERAFCAGADLKERRTLTLEQVREQLAGADDRRHQRRRARRRARARADV